MKPCKLWTRSKTGGGYGLTWVDGKYVYIHRKTYEDAHGKLPRGIKVCHKCDQPACYELDHLFAGTQRDNLQDAAAKGRTRHGSRNNFAKIDEHTALAIFDAAGTHTAIAERFNVSRPTVSLIKAKKIWGRIHTHPPCRGKCQPGEP